MKFVVEDHPHPALVLFLYALTPASVILTSLGAIDHHSLEALFLVVALLGRPWYAVAVLGAFLTTTTWPVVATTIVVAEMLRSSRPAIARVALVIGPFALLIAGRSYFADPWLGEINEMKPLVTSAEGLSKSFELISLALVCLAPAMSIWWRSRADRAPAAALAAALVALPLALLHTRFVVFLAVPGALAAGETIRLLRAHFRPEISTILAAAIFVWALAGLAQIPSGSVDPPIAVRRALEFLRASTPSAGDYFDPRTKPAYGVIASWDLGHVILALGMRPEIASPFHTGPEGRATAERVFFAPPGDATREADDHAARYLLLTKMNLVDGESWTLYERLFLRGDDALGWKRIYASPEPLSVNADTIPAVQIWERRL